MIKINQKGGSLLAEARQPLNYLWKQCRLTGFVGRCYSRGQNRNSPFPGSNIILCDGETIVVIWQEDETGPIEIQTFTKSGSPSPLEQQVIEILRANKLID